MAPSCRPRSASIAEPASIAAKGACAIIGSLSSRRRMALRSCAWWSAWPAGGLPGRSGPAGAAHARQGGDGRDRRLRARRSSLTGVIAAQIADRPLLPGQRQDQRAPRQCRRPCRRRTRCWPASIPTSSRPIWRRPRPALRRPRPCCARRRRPSSARRSCSPAATPRAATTTRPRPPCARPRRSSTRRTSDLKPAAGPALLHRAARRRRRHHHRAHRRGRPGRGPGAAGLHPGARRPARRGVQRPRMGAEQRHLRQGPRHLAGDRIPSVTTLGDVREISPAVNPDTETVTVKVGLRETPHAMTLGALVNGTGADAGRRRSCCCRGARCSRSTASRPSG